MADTNNDSLPPFFEGKTGIPLRQAAVTLACQVIATLKRGKCLDERDRALCETAQKGLEAAEKVLYGHRE